MMSAQRVRRPPRRARSWRSGTRLPPAARSSSPRHVHVGAGSWGTRPRGSRPASCAAVLMSSMSFAVSAGAVRPPPWRLMPLLLDSTPPWRTTVCDLARRAPRSRRARSGRRRAAAPRRAHVARQLLVVEARRARWSPISHAGVEDEALALLERDLAFLELADADLRALQVAHDGDGRGRPCARSRLTSCGALDVVVGRAVREVEPHDVDAGARSCVEDCGVAGSGSQRGDDLGFAWHRKESEGARERASDGYCVTKAPRLQGGRCAAHIGAGVWIARNGVTIRARFQRRDRGQLSCLRGTRGTRRRRSRCSRSCRRCRTC